MNAPLLAQFVDRSTCVACASARLADVASGRFDEGALAGFLRADPWGEDPMPFLVGRTWRFARCEDCGQAFHRHILNAEWNERRFARWMSQEAIEAFERGFASPERAFEAGASRVAHVVRIEKLTRQLRSGPVRLLDFGCGYGEFLATCSLFGFEAVGVDRSTAKREHGRVTILPDLSDIAGQTFHAVTLFEVLEHLDDPRSALEVLMQSLVPGGILVLETPNCEGVTGIETHEDYLRIHPLEHINAFTPATMEAFAGRLGLRRIVPPAAYVSSDAGRAGKQWLKHRLRAGMRRTQQYFVRS
jgi:2-polyprenyl-3-methyl-5-hydroxy-6-metoxy-1,4-benzoquinol methylase